MVSCSLSIKYVVPHLHVNIDTAARLGQPERHVGEGRRARRRYWRGALDLLPLDTDVFIVRRVDPDKRHTMHLVCLQWGCSLAGRGVSGQYP